MRLLWASHLLSPSLSFLSCEMETLGVPAHRPCTGGSTKWPLYWGGRSRAPACGEAEAMGGVRGKEEEAGLLRSCGSPCLMPDDDDLAAISLQVCCVGNHRHRCSCDVPRFSAGLLCASTVLDTLHTSLRPPHPHNSPKKRQPLFCS